MSIFSYENGNGDTKLRWQAMLGASAVAFFLFVAWMTSINNKVSQAADDIEKVKEDSLAAMSSLSDRTTRLEVGYENIKEQLDDIKESQEKIHNAILQLK